MLFSPRVKTKELAEFLRRLGISLEAGIDIRKTLANEAWRSKPALRTRVELIRLEVDSGSSLAEAMNHTGEYFPSLMRELIGVGEQTGHLPEVLRQLTEHYDQQLLLRRTFIAAITWPMMQLAAALTIVGLLIWIMGLIQTATGSRIDMLGFGLVGTRGLIIYITFLLTIAAILYVIIRAVAAGKLWVAPIQRIVLRLPQIGRALRTLAVARFAWTLQLAMEAAMELKRALSLALTSTRNIEFISRREQILESIQRGNEIHEALAEANVFPPELVDAVQVGEQSGRLVETLAVMSRQQQDEARAALTLLTRLAGYAVWFLVAGLIVMLIFRLAGFYLNTIQNAANMR